MVTPPRPSAISDLKAVRQRLTAVEVLLAVHRGRSLDDALPAEADAFTRALIYGVLRHRSRLDAVLVQVMDRPPQPGTPLQSLLHAGLYQLLEMDIAAHAALNETVNACEGLDLQGVRGLVNAVLRRVQREHDALLAAVPDDPALQHSYPPWLVRVIAQDWGARSDQILAAGNQQAPMTLRINPRRTSRGAYAVTLADAGHEAVTLDGLPDALQLRQPVPVDVLPGFADGLCSVQDAAAQRAVDALELAPGQRVLDACAAPGGKTAHALERADITMVAIDQDPARLGKVQHSLRRLGLTAHLILSDAADVRRWWDGQLFDRILIDAPCSGTGVIRRHPDIKWLRRETDLAPLAVIQARLLQRLWPCLKPGGRLVYATCSILNAEGDAVIGPFLEATPDARPAALPLQGGLATRYGLRIAPGDSFDGFYYAALRKVVAAPKQRPRPRPQQGDSKR